jgi:TonB family protein
MKAWVWRAAAIGSIATTSLAAAQPPPAPRWLAFATDGEADYSYDPDSVVRGGNGVTYRMRALLKEERDLAASAILNVEMDCRAQSTTDRRYALYDRAGALIREIEVPAGREEARGIMPGSPEETLYRSLCPERLVRPILPPPMMRTVPVPPPVVMMAPPAPPAPPIAYPPPPPPHLRSRADWVTPPSALITEDDYPAAALRNEEEGAVTIRLDISRQGRVTGCTILGSSGSPSLDSTTCRLFTMRARFTPARDRRGRAAADQKVTRIIWQIPDDLPPEPVPATGEPQPPEQS